MPDELKPCPFCGVVPALEIDEDHHGVFYSLGCGTKNCPCCLAYYTMSPEDDMTVEVAVKTWNTRKCECKTNGDKCQTSN